IWRLDQLPAESRVSAGIAPFRRTHQDGLAFLESPDSRGIRESSGILSDLNVAAGSAAGRKSGIGWNRPVPTNSSRRAGISGIAGLARDSRKLWNPSSRPPWKTIPTPVPTRELRFPG